MFVCTTMEKQAVFYVNNTFVVVHCRCNRGVNFVLIVSLRFCLVCFALFGLYDCFSFVTVRQRFCSDASLVNHTIEFPSGRLGFVHITESRQEVLEVYNGVYSEKLIPLLSSLMMNPDCFTNVNSGMKRR